MKKLDERPVRSDLACVAVAVAVVVVEVLKLTRDVDRVIVSAIE